MSRKRMEDAFVALLGKKNPNAITVSEICRTAGVNRATFYSNYGGIYEIAEAVRCNFEHDLLSSLHSEMASGYRSRDFIRVFTFIRDNRDMCLIYFRLGFDRDYRDTKEDEEITELCFGPGHTDYHMAFFRAGFTRIVKMWLENGLRETPEEMNKIVLTEYRARTEFFSMKED